MAHMQLVIIKKNFFKENPSCVCMKMALPPDVSALKDMEVRKMLKSKVPQIKKEGEKARRGIWMYILSDIETPITPFRWVQIDETEYDALTKGCEETDSSRSEIEDLKDEIKGLQQELEKERAQATAMKKEMEEKNAKIGEYEKFMVAYHEAQKKTE